jgi:hypothetical protein
MKVRELQAFGVSFSVASGVSSTTRLKMTLSRAGRRVENALRGTGDHPDLNLLGPLISHQRHLHFGRRVRAFSIASVNWRSLWTTVTPGGFGSLSTSELNRPSVR